MATLAQDPTHLAYLRALGFEQGEAQRTAQKQIGNVQARQALELPQIQQQGTIARENIAGGFEGRGLLRSGASLKADARQRSDQGYREGSLALGTAEKVGDIESDLARTMAGLGRQQAERGMDLAYRQYLDQGTAPYRTS